MMMQTPRVISERATDLRRLRRQYGDSSGLAFVVEQFHVAWTIARFRHLMLRLCRLSERGPGWPLQAPGNTHTPKGERRRVQHCTVASVDVGQVLERLSL